MNETTAKRLTRFFESPSRVMAGGVLMRAVREFDGLHSDSTASAAIQVLVDAIIADWIQNKLDDRTALCRLSELRDKFVEVLPQSRRYLVPAIRFQVDAAIELVEEERPYETFVDGVEFVI